MIDRLLGGYAAIDDVPFPPELPPANFRCCHGCMRQLGTMWIVVCHDDLTWGIYPFCQRCVDIGMGFVEWTDLADEVERRYADRVVQWVDNYQRKVQSGIFR